MSDQKEEINALQAENAQLRETIERLHQYIERLEKNILTHTEKED